MLELILIVMVLCFVVGYIFGAKRAINNVVDLMRDNPDIILDIIRDFRNAKTKSDQVNETYNANTLKVEESNGVIYLWSKDDKFIAQGSTLEEALDNAIARQKKEPNL